MAGWIRALLQKYAGADKTIYGLLVSLLFGIIISILYYFGFFTKLEYVASDFLRVHFTKKPAETDVVYLLITDATLIEADEVDDIQWPWPRQAYGEAIRFLKNAGAKLVVFDMIFSETSSAGVEDDEAFAESIKAGNVILATLSSDKRGNTSEKKMHANAAKMSRFALKVEDAGFKGIIPQFPYFRPPIDVLLNAADGIGDVKFLADADGVGRRMRLLYRSGDKFYPSLSLAVAMKALGAEKAVLSEHKIMFAAKDGVRRDIPLDNEGMAMLKYYGDSSVYDKMLLLRVIKSQIAMDEGDKPYYDPSRFKGKVVIIGSDATELKDLRPNPFNKKNDAGAHYHGTALDNILHSDFLENYYEPAFAIPAILFLSVVFACVAANFSAGTGLLMTVLFIIADAALAVYLYSYHNILIDISASNITVIGAFSLTSVANYLVEARQRTFITGAFGQYLSPKVVEELVKNPDKLALGGERRVMTAFFSDVAGFSTISEALSPEELVALLNDYLSEMCEITGKYEGTVDKFEGDAIIAFWGAPIATDRHAYLACMASIEMQKRLEELRAKWEAEGKHQMKVRIGLNTGPMVVGNMGSRTRMDYTMMGDAVNLASRLEGANKFYGTYSMISEATREPVKDEFETRELDLLRVVGKNEPVRVYELFGVKGDLPEKIMKGIKLFEEGLKRYRKREFSKAREVFDNVMELIPGDPPSLEYIKRCEFMAQNDPGEQWDGVYTLTSKG